MKTIVSVAWGDSSDVNGASNCDNCFEDSFVESQFTQFKLPDTEQYLARLCSKLRAVQGGTTKEDFVSSLSAAREDYIARLITGTEKFESEKEVELSSNPLIRHIAPHLQALTASELVQLLKADVLQAVTEEHNK